MASTAVNYKYNKMSKQIVTQILSKYKPKRAKTKKNGTNKYNND